MDAPLLEHSQKKPLPGMKRAWAAGGAAFLICAVFGWWFAVQQVALLDTEAHYPPLRLMLGTATRVAVVAFIIYIYCNAYVSSRARMPLAQWLTLLALLPLLAVFFGVGITWALRSSLLMLIGVSLIAFLTRRLDTPHRVSDRHWIAFGIILAIHLMFNRYFNPFNIEYNPFGWPEGYNFENMGSSRMFQSYIWIKQFSLSSFNYAYWLIAPLVTISYESFFLQVMALLTDSPSMDITVFHHLLETLTFFLFLGGAFGFYLLMHVGLRVRWGLSTSGGMLYIFLDPFFGILSLHDRMNEVAVQTAMPYAVLALLCALRDKKLFLAMLSGAALASTLILTTPHPEMIIQMMLWFGMLALAMFFSAPKTTSWKDRIMLLAGCGLSFAVLSAFFMGPVMLLQLSGELFLSGHNEHGNRSLLHLIELDIPPFGLPYLFATLQSYHFLYGKLKGRKLVLPTIMAAMALLLLPLHSPLLLGANAMLHLEGPNMGIYARRGYFIIFLTLILVLQALDKSELYNSLVDSAILPVTRLMNHSRTSRMLIVFWTAMCCIPLQPRMGIPPNPQHCSYYLMLSSLLANYPLLKGDAANTLEIRNRLSTFERDVKSHNATGYDKQYQEALKKFSVATSRDIKGASSLYAFALTAAPIVDRFYFDGAYSCVHPVARHNLGIDGRFIRANIASLYSGLPTPFLRIGDFTDNGTTHTLINATGLLSFGVGPGLFIHNSTMDFDPRFGVGFPMLHGLYLCPGFDFVPLGGYNQNYCGFRPSPTSWFNPLYRKILNISGMDVFLTSRKWAGQFAKADGFEEFTYNGNTPQMPDGNAFMLMRNVQSYGLAYMANHIHYVPESTVAPMAQTIWRYLTKHADKPAFIKSRTWLYQQLGDLKDTHDIVLDFPVAGSDTQAGQSEVAIRNILGEATVMRADCKSETCVLVYNLAALSGWHAYTDGRPLEIHHANFAFMGVELSRGVHEVWFIYSPISYFWFTMISLGGLLALPLFRSKKV